ncbi:MAG: MFS transporter [Alphaproteobacteria bacterium]|nr:MFS transporter [Alphaproteobacteria bacterium]
MHKPLANPAMLDGKLPVSLKLGWATGAFGVAVLMNGISALVLFYMTTVLRFDPAVAGFIIFASKIYDAITDPFSGWLSDRSKSDKGRRRPFLFWGALVSAAAFLMVFTVPFIGPFPSMTEGPGLVAAGYMLLALLIYTTGYSMFNVPYMAMPAEMTRDYHERSSIHGYRVVIAAIGGFLVQSGGGALLEVLGKDWDAYAMLAAAGAGAILVTMLIAYAATARAPAMPQTDTKLPFREQVKGFLANRPFQLILSVKLVQLIGIAASSGGLVFLLASVLGRPLTLMGLIGAAMIAAVFISTPLLVRLSKVIGKRGAYMVSAAVTGVAALSWALATPDEPIWALMLRGFGTGIAFAGNVLFAMSMLTDAMEIDAHRTGLRREGMYSALYSFVEKLAAAIGPLILGGALSVAKFDAGKSSIGDEGVRQAVLVGIAYVPAAMAVLAVIILFFYRLDEKQLAEIRANSVLKEA